MAHPAKMNTVALTNHESDNDWVLAKPSDKNSAPNTMLFVNSTEDYVFSFEATDTLRDANNVTVDVSAWLNGYEFKHGVQGEIWVKKAAAAATDQNVICVY